MERWPAAATDEHLGDRGAVRPLPPSTVQAGVRDSDGERVSLLPVLLGIVVVVVGVVGDNGSEERWCPFKRRR